MGTSRNGTHQTPEAKLLKAVEPHLEKLSDEEIAEKIAATEKILASPSRRVESRGASRPKPVARGR
jgi:hypothetical protein